MMQQLLTMGIGHKKFKKVKELLGKEIEIPEEWRVVKIKDIGSSSAGGTPSRSTISYWKNGTIPWLSSGEIRNNLILTSHEKITELGLKESATKIFPKGSIMLAITGQGKTRGRTGLLGIDSSTNQSVVGIETYDDVSNIYFWYYLQNQYNKLRSISQGSNQSGLNLKLIHNYKVFLPPLTEQQKIASILSEVDALIESTQKVIEKTKRLKKGLMQKLLTKGIGHTKFKKVKWLFGKEIEIPQEWNITRLIEQCIQKPEYGAGESAIEKDLKLPRYIRITDLNDDGSLRNKEWKSIKENAAKDYLLNNNDILFARTGATVGKSYLYTDEDGRCAFAGYLIRFQPNQTKLNSKFLFHYIHSIYYWEYIKSIQTWGVQPNVNAEQYSNLLILLSPIHEQQKIASILSGVDARRHRNIIALIILRIKLAIFLILFVGISVNACKNILVAVQVMDRPLCETVLRTL